MNTFYRIIYIMLWVLLALFLIKAFFAVLLVGFLVLCLHSWSIKKDPRNTIFLKGSVPNPKLDGVYRGIFLGYSSSWKGKKLNAIDSTGINMFAGHKSAPDSNDQVEKYPFKTYIGKGLVDKNLDVLKIDYNLLGNPFWLKWIVDEVVQIAPNEYLGKMHLNIIPGFPFSLLYFQLSKRSE